MVFICLLRCCLVFVCVSVCWWLVVYYVVWLCVYLIVGIWLWLSVLMVFVGFWFMWLCLLLVVCTGLMAIVFDYWLVVSRVAFGYLICLLFIVYLWLRWFGCVVNMIVFGVDWCVIVGSGCLVLNSVVYVFVRHFRWFVMIICLVCYLLVVFRWFEVWVFCLVGILLFGWCLDV